MDKDTFNQTKITLNTNGDNKDVAKDDENVVDDDDDDPIMGNEIKNQQQYGFQVPKENSKLLLNKTTAVKGATIATETAAIRTIETTKYLKTKQKPIEYENENYKPKNHYNQNRYHYHKHYKHNHKTNHLYDYLLTTLKFNQGNSFYLNNKLKTIIEKDAMDNDAKQNEYNERQTDKDLKEEEEKKHEEKPKNNDNIKEKFQMKYVPAITPSFGFSNGWLGQLPQFQIPTLLPQQQLQLFLQQPMQQQQQEQQQQSTIFTTASLLPQEYHHLSDYRFLFNAERHTEFYLHTLTNPPAAAVATKDAATQTTTTTTLASFEESEDTDEDVDDDVYYDNDYFNDNDDDDNVKDDEKLSTTMLNLTNPRVLNVVTDTIGAVFGVNTRPVAGIQGIHIEEIELYNGLSLRQSRFNPFNPCR